MRDSGPETTLHIRNTARRFGLLTVAVNAAVIVWVVLLIFAPSLLFAAYRGSSPAIFAGGGAATMVVLCLVTWIVCSNGYGDIIPLRCCAAVLALALVWALVKAALLLRARRLRRPGPGVLAVPAGMVLGIWVLVPPLLAISKSGVKFGVATIGNNDIANYVLTAENTALAGFTDTHHLANSNLGAFGRESYIGATVLMNFVSASTGLTTIQATMATIGVATALLAVALLALGSAVWPTARWSVFAAVAIAILAALNTYATGQYFLGAILGLTSIATALTGATLTGRQGGRSALLLVAAGGALGIYSYAHLGLPALVALPFWSLVVSLLAARRSRAHLLRALARCGACVLIALLMAAPILSEAIALVRSQSDVEAGYTLPGLTSLATFVSPGGIGEPNSHATVITSWLALLAVLAVALVLARRGGHGTSAGIATLALITFCLAIVGSIIVYGPDRYQTWKMQTYVLPLATAAVFPVLGTLRGRVPVTRVALAALTLAVTLCPFLTWKAADVQHDPTKLASATLLRLDITPELAGVTRLNIRMPSYFETMIAGAAFTRSAVVFSNVTYYYPMVSLTTCTLTKRSMLAQDETDFVDIGDGYVLIDHPARCR